MRYGLFRLQLGLIIIGLGATVWGGHMTLVGMSNMSPTQMKYDDYTKQDANAEWLVLDDCLIDYTASCAIDQVEEKTGRKTSTEYYTAIFSMNEDNDNVKAFIVVTDPGKKKLIEEWWAVPEDKSDAWYEQNQARCVEKNVQIKGLARSGLDLDSDDQRLIKQMAPGVNPNFQIIERNKEPQGFLGFVILLAGLGMLGGGGFWMFASIRGNKKKPAAYPPPYRGPPRPGVPGRPGPGWQPGMPAPPMPGAVQQAPPPQAAPLPPAPGRGVAPPYPGNVQAPPPARPPMPQHPQRGPSPGGPSIPRPRRRPPM